VPKGGVVRKLKKLIIAIAMAGPAACLAGPYCVVVPGMGKDCHYYDEASCARAAVERHGGCVDKHTGIATGLSKDSRYCLVGAGEAKCYYYDAASCARAAQDQGGTCLQRHRFGT
jgi:hypothetical protein